MPRPDCVFRRLADDRFHPTVLSSGPWDVDAQHGGAPAGLVAGLAESALAADGYRLQRLTLELARPVPVAPLEAVVTVGDGRSVRRVCVELRHEDAAVASAVVLMVRSAPVDMAVAPDDRPLRPLADCNEVMHIAGMPLRDSFHCTAMEARVASGSTREPGPAAVWMRLTVPLIGGQETSAAMRAVAAADFGNGLSWVLPLDRYLFANTELTVYLQRPPRSEWIGVDSRTSVDASGVGLTRTTLHDEEGPVGVALQHLLVRQRRAT